MTAQLRVTGNQQMADDAARELHEQFHFSFVRIWLLDPPGTSIAGRRVTIANAPANGAEMHGGLSNAAVASAIASASTGPLLVTDASSDGRFEGLMAGTTFLGTSLVFDDLRYGFVEAYASTPLSPQTVDAFGVAAEALARLLASAGPTRALESSGRGRVLIADDDSSTRSLLRTVLTRRGFTVTDVANGAAAFEVAKEQLPDLVLLDWLMPVMDGRQTTSRLKADPATRHIPVVMLTSQSRIDDKVDALEAGAQDYLTKPFDARELVARIEQQLRWRKLLGDSDVDEAPATRPSRPDANDQPRLPKDLFAGDSWTKAVEFSQLGKHREALALYLNEAERCDHAKLFARAAIAYRSGSIAAGHMQNLDLSNKLLRLAGKMYLSWAETANDTRAMQEAYLNAARCFLSAGNLKLAKKSVDYAHSIETVIADDHPPLL